MLLGRIHGRRRDRTRFVADTRLRARRLSGLERLSEKPVKDLAERFGVLGLNVRVFDLA